MDLNAAELRAEEHETEVDEDALQASSDAFRYEHDLISAGETEVWLEARGMNTDDFSTWFHQQLCAATFAAEEAEEQTIAEEFPRLLRVHLWMSGAMEELAEDLKRRVAAGLEISERAEPAASESLIDEVMEQKSLDERGLSDWLEGLGRDRSWLVNTARLEAAFQRLSALAINPEARSRALAASRLSLERVQIETLDLDSEAAAREAFLCVRDDHMSLTDVAQQSGYRSERNGMWMETADAVLGPRLLGCAEGDVIGPLPWKNRFRVCQVLRRVAPTISDPAVCQRLDKMIIDQHFAGVCSRHIQAPAVSPIAK